MARYGLSETEWQALEDEVLELFTALLRVDTTNGNETEAALVVQAYLAENGIPSELDGELPDRQSLVARLDGARPGATLTMMGHLDVVPADAGEWSVPPFAGVVKDGYVWGVGATDMKNQVAAEAVALARLKRSGAAFAGTVKYAATADEEDGELCGVQWLCEHRPDALRADYLVNEGMGGLWLPVDGRKVFLLAVGEKAFAQFRIRTRGRGGHGSVPEKERSAVIDLARAVMALGLADPPAIVSGTTARFIDVLVPDRELAARLKDPATARAAGAELRRLDPVVAGLVEPLFGATLTPTVLDAGKAVNVIPTRAEACIDCRILPEMTHDDVTGVRGLRPRPARHRVGVRVGRRDDPQRVAAVHALQREHRAGAAPGRPRRRPRAHDLGQLHRLALGARGVPGLRRLRVRALRRRELPRHGRRPRPRAGRAHPRRGRHLPGALLRAAREGPARVIPVVDPSVARDRFRGALLGLAVGEALGAPAEFLTAEQVVEKYGVITEMIGGGVYDVAPGEITDATEMMLCLAESLADHGALRPRGHHRALRRLVREPAAAREPHGARRAHQLPLGHALGRRLAARLRDPRRADGRQRQPHPLRPRRPALQRRRGGAPRACRSASPR